MVTILGFLDTATVAFGVFCVLIGTAMFIATRATPGFLRMFAIAVGLTGLLIIFMGVAFDVNNDPAPNDQGPPPIR